MMMLRPSIGSGVLFLHSNSLFKVLVKQFEDGSMGFTDLYSRSLLQQS
jgi:hypothetical protein